MWGDYAVQSIDSSDPLNPVVLNTIAMKSIWPQSASLDGNLFFHTSINTVNIIDVSQPDNMKLLKTLEVPGVRSTATDGTTLVVGGTDHLFIYDITDPANPVLQSQTASPQIHTLKVKGDMAYLGYDEYPDIGVATMDITDRYN